MADIEIPTIARYLTLVVIGFALGILGTTAYVQRIEQGTMNLDLMGLFVETALTIGLIGLYSKMATTQERQTTLTEIERTPLVEISGYEADGDDLEVYLSNYGNGTATNLELVTVSYFESDADNLEPGTSAEPLRRAVDEASHNYEQSIQPHDRRVAFTASPGLVVHQDMERGGFQLGISQLKSAGVEDVGFQLYVRYSTRTGKRYSIPLFDIPRVVDVDEDQTFGDAYHVKSGVHSPPGFIPDPDYEMPPYLTEDPGHPVRRDEIDS